MPGSVEYKSLEQNIKTMDACEKLRICSIKPGVYSMPELKKLVMTVQDAGVAFPVGHQQVPSHIPLKHVLHQMP